MKKRIILLRPKIGFDLGGAESHAANVVIKLLERDFKIGLIAHTINFSEEVLRKIEIYPIKYKGFGSIPKHLIFIYQAQKILSKLSNYYLISFFRYPYFSDLFIMCDPLLAFLIRQKRPFGWKFRPRYQILLNLEKETLFKARKNVALFSLGKLLIKKFYPEVFFKTVICYRGIDFKRFKPELKLKKTVLRKTKGFKEEDYLLLFIGYDIKRKGLDLLLNILPRLPSQIKLLIAGKEGVSSERIIYLGKVKDIENYLALSDLFVLPTLYDPGALATLEALASGTPVITTPFDGTSEFVKDGLNGFVIERNQETLRKTILKAIEISFDPWKIAQSVRHLTWDNYVDCLISQLESL